MSDDAVPIPPSLWDRIKAFLADGRTGALTLNANQGRVMSLEIRERVEPRRGGPQGPAAGA